MRQLVVATMIGVLGSVWPVQAGGEIHGTILTEEGKEFTGPIRWDKNENYWNDILDARKEDTVYDREGGVVVYLFGKKIVDVDEDNRVHPAFTIPFGHIRSLKPRSGSRAQLTLKNGDEFQILASSTDIGRSIRGLVVQDEKRGKTSLDWDEIEQIEFSGAAGPGRDPERLYGTVETRAGPFTGFVVWDMDESMYEDVLDGEEDGRDREIPFREIREIEKIDERSSRVSLAGGRTRILDGTNDVNSGNRGILVTIPGLGQVRIHWGQFDKVRFSQAPRSPRYGEFDGGRKLAGTVSTSAGATHTGEIVWDRDERYSWESLDGRSNRFTYESLFENIASIHRVSGRSAEVHLKNGQVLTLSGSNDVNSENKGIQVSPKGGEEVEIGWEEFLKVEFSGS